MSTIAETPARSRKLRWWIRLPLIAALACGVVVGVFTAVVAATPIPEPSTSSLARTSVVYYSDGVSEIGWLGAVNRRPVPLSSVSVPVREAFLAAEDRGFYSHFGVSPEGIVRAAVNNMTGGDVQGGSTITQQYVKNAFLTPERSVGRKFREIVLSLKLDATESKDSILENYLNTIYFGRGAYGVEAASYMYFGVPASDLNHEQGAVLASLANAPTFYSDPSNEVALRDRWLVVMAVLADEGYVPGLASDAEFPKMRDTSGKNRLGGQAGYLLEMVRADLAQMGFRSTDISLGGLRVVSTFDRRLQKAAVRAVNKVGPGRGQGQRVGLASVDPVSGDVKAIYGGPDFVSSSINNATRQYAQAGSVFKTFALAAAAGQGIDADSLWDGNSPLTVDGYTVRNNDDLSFGTVTLSAATDWSVNTAFVELTEFVSPRAVSSAAVRMGIPVDTPGLNVLNPGLTVSLGTASPSVVDVASSYGVLASGGVRVPWGTVKEVVATSGAVTTPNRSRMKVLAPDVVAGVTGMLEGTVSSGTAQRAQQLGRPAAGKTGTSDGSRSMWFAGYTPQVSTAVLVSRDGPGGEMLSVDGLTGGDPDPVSGYPISVWVEFMQDALRGVPVESFRLSPSDLS